jgi:hypothetical protein
MSPKNIATTAVISLLVVVAFERYKTGGKR